MTKLELARETASSDVATALVDAGQALDRRLIGDSLPMQKLLSVVECVAVKDITVLVRGETGTGKELIASLLHAASRRASRPFVKFNCAALAPELAESQLFGHTRGAFTGAVTAQRGFFAEADGGTLLLDEVGELGATTQAALLRALQEGEIQPVGATRPEKVDVRVIAATNRDLAAEVRAGRFREDLYYRLAVVDLVIPPLRDRRIDIPCLVEEFAARYARRFGVELVRLAPDLIGRLTALPWPGNVRQLENTVARLVAMSRGGHIDPGLLDPEQPVEPPMEPCEPALARHASAMRSASLSDQMMAFERALLANAFAATGGNQSETARRLSVSRTTLIDKLKKHGIGCEP
jgi:two-component system response regulator AtoC